MSQYREAHEEVGLPRHCPHVHTVCTLRPYISSAKLLVTPVVALLTESKNMRRDLEKFKRMIDQLEGKYQRYTGEVAHAKASVAGCSE